MPPQQFPEDNEVGEEGQVARARLGSGSSSSVTTIKRSPNPTDQAVDVEASRPPPGAVPSLLSDMSWAVLLFLLVADATVLEVLLYKNSHHKGWPTPSWWQTQSFSVRYYLVTSIPVVATMAVSALWEAVKNAILILQPLANLTSDSAEEEKRAEKTVLLDYAGSFLPIAVYKAARYRNYMVLLVLSGTLLSHTLTPLANAMVSLRSVWWTNEPYSVVGVTKVTQDVENQFMDMIAFQGASGFATASVLFDVAPPAFVTADGHTVEAFELPVGQNGTAYANVTSVFNRAVCVSPTDFQMVNDASTMVWHNTAWFDECQFSWSVINDSSNLFGVDTLPDLAGCSNFTGTPLEHRPVIFWFFSYEPQPIFSVVQCTPQVSVSNVQVAIDLVSNATSLMTINETTTSTIGSLGYLPYNGLFFDQGMLDQTAMSRLRSVQEQLPSAVFQAAKARDPELMNTFAYSGFTDITADIYNMYLSLIAETLYFAPSQEPVLIQVGAYCQRLFLVPLAIHALAGVLLVLAAYGVVIWICHRRIRRRFTIPEYYGTIATGYLIPVDPMASTALQEAAQSKQGISSSLADCRFHIDVRTGVLGMKRVRTDKPMGKLQRLRAWLGRPWRAVLELGAKTTRRTETDAEVLSNISSASSMCSRCRSPATVATASSVTLLAQV